LTDTDNQNSTGKYTSKYNSKANNAKYSKSTTTQDQSLHKTLGQVMRWAYSRMLPSPHGTSEPKYHCHEISEMLMIVTHYSWKQSC